MTERTTSECWYHHLPLHTHKCWSWSPKSARKYWPPRLTHFKLLTVFCRRSPRRSYHKGRLESWIEFNRTASHPKSEGQGPNIPQCTFLHRKIGCPPAEVSHLVHLSKIAYASQPGYLVQVSLGPWSPARWANTLFLGNTRNTIVPGSDTHHCLSFCYIG